MMELAEEQMEGTLGREVISTQQRLRTFDAARASMRRFPSLPAWGVDRADAPACRCAGERAGGSRALCRCDHGMEFFERIAALGYHLRGGCDWN